MEERLHLKGLNGLRAIAAICVVLAHLRILLPEFSTLSKRPFDISNYAVTIFFTLSGFLITYLLFTEKKKSEISIKKFYIRRVLRIWPLYFTYLAAVILTIYIYTPDKLPGSLVYYIFFAANIPGIFNNHLPYMAQYWSLGVEEQFYIFWPWLIKKSDKILKTLIIFTICFFILKLIFFFIYFKWGNSLPLRIVEINRFECMSIGGIAAILCIQQHKRFLAIATHKLTQVICWLSLLLMALNKFHVSYFPDNDLAALVTVGLIVNLSFNNMALINLETRLFDFLGKISYGIYIIHPLVIFYYANFLNQLNVSPVLKIVLVYAGVILLTILSAWLSHEFLEKRFLRLKDRFSTIKSLPSKY